MYHPAGWRPEAEEQNDVTGALSESAPGLFPVFRAW